MQKVAIIILNWNGKKDTKECLKSVEDMSSGEINLVRVVVDNASSDGSFEELVKLESEGLHTIRNKKNYGFAKGNNVGINYAIREKGVEYVMILNNDTIVDKNLLLKMVNYMNKNPKVGAVSPKIYFAKGYEFHKERYQKSELGRVVWYAGGKIDWKNVYGSNLGVDEVDKGQHDGVKETDFATGACSLLRVEALKEVGLYNEDYYMYLEDVDLSQRFKEKGWQVKYFGSAHLWHKVARSSSIGSFLNDYFITRNRLLFGFKYASLRARMALLREALRFLFAGKKWQKVAVKDFFLKKLGRGSWIDIKN